MHQMMIFGTSTAAYAFRRLIDFNKTKVIAYIDNDEKKQGSRIDDIPVISPDKITGFEYDYISIASSYNKEICSQLLGMGVDYSKIFQYSKHFAPYYKIADFKNSNLDYEGFITGKSYATYGLKPAMFNKKLFDFSFPGQDIPHDYHVANHVLIDQKYRTSNFKYALIQLDYYSFDYDLTKSKDYSPMRYSPLFSDAIIHEKFCTGKLTEEFTNHKKIAKKILVINYKNQILHHCKVSHERTIQNHEKKTLTSQEILQFHGKNTIYSIAKKEFNKDFPETRKINKLYFSKYMELLSDLNIIPYIIVCPQLNHIRDILNSHIRDKFYEILDELQTRYQFKLIDCFFSDLFSETDFYDMKHLNNIGAQKVADLINHELDGSNQSRQSGGH